MLPILGIAAAMEAVSNSSDAISATLDQVGSRLKQIRIQRGITLVDLSERTGISKSTLSRLENGQRRPALELLLPLAQAYRVPLDDLVGAPDVGDPRVRLKPRRVKGRTVLPLTPPGGIQAWKIIIPATQSTPNLRTHDGYEWLYVLSGQMRLILGEEDTVLGTGEAVEFDTTRPHWFGSTGEGPAEVLSLFGRPGERIHVRASSPHDQPDGSATALPGVLGRGPAMTPPGPRGSYDP
jgi:transcriptional regulator with XRE-family HTH domain